MLFAQDVLKAVLLEEHTNKGIDLVCINIKNSTKGSYSCIDGKFELEKLNNKDSIVFHHISYKEKTLAYGDLPKDGIIYLSPLVNELKEVSVCKASRKEYKLLPRRQLLYDPYHKAGKGAEIATLVQNSKLESAYVKEFIFYTREIEVDNYIMMIHLYENKNGVPGKEILIMPNKLCLIKGSTIQKVDINDNNIIFPKEGLFCGLEWIGVETSKDANKSIKEDIKTQPSILFRKIRDGERSFISFFGRRNWEEDTYALGFQNSRYLLGLTLIK